PPTNPAVVAIKVDFKVQPWRYLDPFVTILSPFVPGSMAFFDRPLQRINGDLPNKGSIKVREHSKERQQEAKMKLWHARKELLGRREERMNNVRRVEAVAQSLTPLPFINKEGKKVEFGPNGNNNFPAPRRRSVEIAAQNQREFQAFKKQFLARGPKPNRKSFSERICVTPAEN
ncbi:hypothetical protein MP638_002312, partial [Amoeboaphelidium occidentale]